MLTSRVPATIDALVAGFTAAGLKTWDGPVLTGDFADSVYVGYDGDPEGDYEAATMDQQWAGLGAKARTETFDIICAVVVLIGDDGPQIVKMARDTAYSMLATAETVLRADPSLAQIPMFVAEIRPMAIYIEPGPQGDQARLVFHIHVQTRI